MQPVTENLTYTSAARLREVWPSRSSSVAAAIPYVRNPQGLANRVYANRMGNGSEASSDGWRYRGRALPQVTGRENYEKASKLVGVDLIASPDRANDTAISARILIEGMRGGMFTGKRLSDFIAGDKADYVGARAIINSDVKANGKTIAGYALAFETALRADAYIGQAPKTITIPPEKPVETIVVTPASTKPQPEPTATPAAKGGFWPRSETFLLSSPIKEPDMGPYVRILLRYGVGAVIGYQLGDQLSNDPDVVTVATVAATAAVGVATEFAYHLARRFGWKL